MNTKPSIAPDEPFRTKLRKPWLPRDMVEEPWLDPMLSSETVEPCYALLVNPFYRKDPHGSFGKHVLTPSLALTSIAAATPVGWRVAVWDENLLQGRAPFDPMPEVVGITVHLTFAERAYELAQWFRARGAKVVLGGMHVMSCPEEALQHADAIALGDGVKLWPLILADCMRGALKRSYRAEFGANYAADPVPRRDLLPQRSFLTTSSLIATRGCNNRCGFCYLSTNGVRMPFAARDVNQVAREFAANGQPYGVFIDNNLGANPPYLRSLCRALRPLDKIWSAAVGLDVTDDPALVREMAMAGCTGVFIGFETLSASNLAAAHKRTPKPEDYARRIDILHACGIQVNGSFVVGFDDDTKDSFAALAEWIEANRLECATFHILTPYPGTPLFRKMEAEGRLLHKKWSLYDTAHVVFQPKHMTPNELEQGYGWLYQRIFSSASIWKRRPEDVKAVLPYLAMAYLYKKSNRLWHFLIRANLTHAVWRPMVEWTRLRHLAFRRRLVGAEIKPIGALRASSVVSAGL